MPTSYVRYVTLKSREYCLLVNCGYFKAICDDVIAVMTTEDVNVNNLKVFSVGRARMC